MSQAVLKTAIEDSTAVAPAVAPARPRLSAVPGVDRAASRARRLRAMATTLALGALSTVLYLLLFRYGDTLAALAAETRHGHRVYALVPIAIAFVFSVVHGAFTGHFWDVLGLRAKGR